PDRSGLSGWHAFWQSRRARRGARNVEARAGGRVLRKARHRDALAMRAAECRRERERRAVLSEQHWRNVWTLLSGFCAAVLSGSPAMRRRDVQSILSRDACRRRL